MKAVIAGVLLSTASFATFTFAQQQESIQPRAPVTQADVTEEAATPMDASLQSEVPDARSVASDQEVGIARRTYRAQCRRHESPGFCECVTAGVAQALAPSDVRLAARTIGERIGAQGDAPAAENTDQTPVGADAMTRIAQVEGHYASACAALR